MSVLILKLNQFSSPIKRGAENCNAMCVLGNHEATFLSFCWAGEPSHNLPFPWVKVHPNLTDEVGQGSQWGKEANVT